MTAMAAFELRAIPAGTRARLFLVQLPMRTELVAASEEVVTRWRAEGATLRAVEGAIASILERGGVAGAGGDGARAGGGLSETLGDGGCVPIPEGVAVHLLLLAHASGAERAPDRVQTLAEAAAALEAEDVRYWARKLMGSGGEEGRVELYRQTLVTLLRSAAAAGAAAGTPGTGAGGRGSRGSASGSGRGSSRESPRDVGRESGGEPGREGAEEREPVARDRVERAAVGASREAGRRAAPDGRMSEAGEDRSEAGLAAAAADAL